MSNATEQAAAALEAAKATYQRDLGALVDGQGNRLYADREHERRELSIWSAYRDAIKATGEVAAAEARAAHDEMRQLDEKASADPLAQLWTVDLPRANAMAPFVAEDYRDVSADQLAPRAEAALAGTNRVEQALHVRYGRRYFDRLDAERGQDGLPEAVNGHFVPRGPAPRTAGQARLEAAVRALAETFSDPDDARRRTEAEARRDAAGALAAAAMMAEYNLETYGARPATMMRPYSVASG